MGFSRILFPNHHERRFTRYASLEDDAGARRLHPEDLNGAVHVLGGVVEKVVLAVGHLQ
jgi:hypothetical protein